MIVNKFQLAFAKTGTDKLVHGYHRMYHEILGEANIESLLEIGLYKGQSIQAWPMIWPDADIEGIDLEKIYDPSLEKDFTIYNIDSQDPEQTKIIDKNYDLIIDDAAHHWRCQVATFNNFYDKAKKFYVIEDVLGQYCIEKLRANLPESELKRAMLFKSTGPTRNFRFSEYVEKNASFYMMIFDKSA